MYGILRVIGGLDKGRMFTLVDGQSIVLGRGEGIDADLRDPKVAFHHCEVRLAHNHVTIRDAGSVSGTWVNHQRITEQELLPGDLIRIGQTQLSFQWTTIDEDTTRHDQKALGRRNDDA